mmetsp:Transcript_103174/g.163037  ORF Transcript_103174/g.163037 Transcript_103174/m.163037 type:complete len:202 (-) Transcript_103174:245-850(-)
MIFEMSSSKSCNGQLLERTSTSHRESTNAVNSSLSSCFASSLNIPHLLTPTFVIPSSSASGPTGRIGLLDINFNLERWSGFNPPNLCAFTIARQIGSGASLDFPDAISANWSTGASGATVPQLNRDMKIFPSKDFRTSTGRLAMGSPGLAGSALRSTSLGLYNPTLDSPSRPGTHFEEHKVRTHAAAPNCNLEASGCAGGR